MNSLYIIGMGDDGQATLGARALSRVEEADLLLGGERLLRFFEHLRCEKIAIKSNLSECSDLIKKRLPSARIVVLASGDPGFFGIARYLVGELGKENVEIIPNVSSIQLAFARIKESWEDAVLLSAHARPIDAVVEAVKQNPKVAILTDAMNTPAAIASALLKASIDEGRAYVCENLGGSGETITEATIAELVGMSCSPMNVIVLIRDIDRRPSPIIWSPGIPDDEFHQRKPLRGLITKAEVRVISLSKLRLSGDSTVWDVGAGCGSVSIEASLLARNGKVYAVEKETINIANIQKNVEKFSAHNVAVIQGTAPDVLTTLPGPDAVFVGGSGGKLGEILEEVGRRLRPSGRIVVNLATISNLSDAVQKLKQLGFQADVTLVNVARSKPVGELVRFESLDPVFVIAASRGAGRRE